MPRHRFLRLLVSIVLVALCAACSPAPDDAEPADFDYYVLVLGWSPSYCASEEAKPHERQCAGRHAFVLHGLWPQYFNGWPQDCRGKQRSWVPERVIQDMGDIMPSKGLIIHEYRTHGLCAGLTPAEYFGVARQLYERVAIPARFTGLARPLTLSPDAIEAEFLSVNPWLRPNMISVSCRRDKLLDVRLCFGRDLLPRSCGPNEERRLCRARDITVLPANPR